MKFKVILCLALLILIALGGLNDLMAKKNPSAKSLTVKAHPWEPSANATKCSKLAPVRVFLVIYARTGFAPFFAVGLFTATAEGNHRGERVLESYRGKENVEEANKDPRKGDQEKAVHY